jgi:dihydrofolate reductase
VAVRKLIVTQFVSLDGVVQAPGHAQEDLEGGFEHGGWIGRQIAEHGRYNHDFFQTVGAFLLGRVTYEIFAGYWPTVTDPGDEIARALNTLPKYVASTGLSAPEWAGTTVIADDVPGEVARLKEQPGKPILVRDRQAPIPRRKPDRFDAARGEHDDGERPGDPHLRSRRRTCSS